MKNLKDFLFAWFAEFRSARAVQVTIALTCVITFIQVIGDTNPNIGVHSALRVTATAFADGEFWRPLTANFVHLAKIPHLMLNMVGLALAGPFVERDYGSLRFIILYLLPGYVAWSVRSILGKSGSGASAALVGVFAALLVSSIARYSDSSRARRLVVLAILLSTAWLLGGFLIDDRRILPFIEPVNIANDVHVVGFVVGLLLGCIVLPRQSAQRQF